MTATRRRIARKYKHAEGPEPRPFLHLRCGTDIFGSLAAAGIPGERSAWFDPLCEGPLRRSDDVRYRERAAYLSPRFDVPVSEVFRDLKAADTRVDRCVEYDETVLWFEADLFDQVILVFLLDRLQRFAGRARISLICIGEHPGVDRFIGLGQLNGAQLAALLPQRQPVSPRQLRLAATAWAAFTATDPRALIRLSRSRNRTLPFLAPAVQRYLAEYPSVENGLSRTAQYGLEALEAGAATAMEAFPLVQRREPRPFMGDSMFYAAMRELASGTHPAVAGERPHLDRLPVDVMCSCRIWPTDLGRQLLRRRADWCAINGTTRVQGGVVLRGSRPRWRWSEAEERIIEKRR